MDAADLKIEFDKQVKDADLKIAEAEKQLAQLKEYKLKYIAGSKAFYNFLIIF